MNQTQIILSTGLLLVLALIVYALRELHMQARIATLRKNIAAKEDQLDRVGLSDQFDIVLEELRVLEAELRKLEGI